MDAANGSMLPCPRYAKGRVVKAESTEPRFDEDTHTYHVGDRLLPSVTQVLDEAGLIDKEWFTEEHMLRGKRVHIATAMHDEGLEVFRLTTDERGCLAAWCKFREESNCEIISIEERVWSTVWGVAGTIDRRLIINGGAMTGDIKSGGPARWHKLQTAGYGVCQGSREPRICIYLKPDGTYKIQMHNDSSDFDAFHAFLAGYNWKLKEGLIE